MNIDTHTSLNFDFSETQQMVASSAREFAEQYIRPFVMEWDELEHFPVDVLNKAGSFGFMGILVPETYGGSGLGYHEYVAIISEISKIDRNCKKRQNGEQSRR